MQQDCTLGYASNCPYLPAQREADAIRFAVSSESDSHISVSYACERNHLPASHGNLEYRIHDARWMSPHPDPRIQRMAECFVESWLGKLVPLKS